MSVDSARIGFHIDGHVATVTLNGPAPASGAVVNLQSSNTAVATVPSKIVIPGGATSRTFNVKTTAVASNATANISATYDGLTKSAPLAVTPSSLIGLSLVPATLIGGCTTSTGKVTLSGPAPSAGARVTLANTNTAARVPSSVTVPAGSSTVTFIITTLAQSVERTGEVTASYRGVSKSAQLKVRPIGVLALSLDPNPVVGPANATGTVTLHCEAPSGGVTVQLSSSGPLIAGPAVNSIVVPAGSSTQTFTVHTTDGTEPRKVVIRATANGITKSVTLTVN